MSKRRLQVRIASVPCLANQKNNIFFGGEVCPTPASGEKPAGNCTFDRPQVRDQTSTAGADQSQDGPKSLTELFKMVGVGQS